MGQAGYIKKVIRARVALGKALSVVSLMLAKGKIDEAEASKTFRDEIRGIVKKHPLKFSYVAYKSLMDDVVKKNQNPVIKVRDGNETLRVRLFYEPLVAYFEGVVEEKT